MPDGVDTIIGERGSKLSGGQIQRIGIGRTLYNDSDLIILDEATSQLDYKTEEKIINELKLISKNITFIIISHRKTINDYCDKVINL